MTAKSRVFQTDKHYHAQQQSEEPVQLFEVFDQFTPFYPNCTRSNYSSIGNHAMASTIRD
jgi:hypothetical protein